MIRVLIATLFLIQTALGQNDGIEKQTLIANSLLAKQALNWMHPYNTRDHRIDHVEDLIDESTLEEIALLVNQGIVTWPEVLRAANMNALDAVTPDQVKKYYRDLNQVEITPIATMPPLYDLLSELSEEKPLIPFINIKVKAKTLVGLTIINQGVAYQCEIEQEVPGQINIGIKQNKSVYAPLKLTLPLEKEAPRFFLQNKIGHVASKNLTIDINKNCRVLDESNIAIIQKNLQVQAYLLN